MACLKSAACLLVLLAVVAQACASPDLYVVYMGSHSGDVEPESIHAIHQELLTSVVGSKEVVHDVGLVYSYKHFINGFAAFLEPHHVSAMSEMPGVVSIFRNRAHKLHTTRSWEFLGLEHPSGATSIQSLWKKANYGEDVIIGMMDTAYVQEFGRSPKASMTEASDPFLKDGKVFVRAAQISRLPTVIEIRDPKDLGVVVWRSSLSDLNLGRQTYAYQSVHDPKYATALHSMERVRQYHQHTLPYATLLSKGLRTKYPLCGHQMLALILVFS